MQKGQVLRPLQHTLTQDFPGMRPPPPLPHPQWRGRNGRAGDTSPHCKIRRLALEMSVAYFGCVSFKARSKISLLISGSFISFNQHWREQART